MEIYSVVIPVFNAEKSIEELYQRMRQVFEQYEEKDFELIFIDDSSTDQSYKIMKKLHEYDKRISLIRLAKNCGQHAALLCGFRNCKGDYVITMDDDLQHPPEEIPKLIRFMDDHPENDVVIGRYDHKQHNVIRNLGSVLSGYVSFCIFHKRKDLQFTSFRLMRRKVIDNLCKLHINIPRIGNMLLLVTNRIENVTVEHHVRKYGRSGYHFRQLVKDFNNNVLTNSAFPLIVVRDIGIGSFLFSLFLAIYYFTRYILYGVSIQGWTTLVILLLLFSGLILLSVGMIGDYLIRILNESKKIPNYFIREKFLGDEKDETESY